MWGVGGYCLQCTRPTRYSVPCLEEEGSSTSTMQTTLLANTRSCDQKIRQPSLEKIGERSLNCHSTFKYKSCRQDDTRCNVCIPGECLLIVSSTQPSWSSSRWLLQASRSLASAMPFPTASELKEHNAL